MKELFAIAVLVAVVSIMSLPHVAAQSTDVPATAQICGIELKVYNSTNDRNTDTRVPDGVTGLNFGTLNHGTLSDKKVLELSSKNDDPVTLRIFASDWNDFDGNFVMNGNQTRVTPDLNDQYFAAFPLNMTGQYTPDSSTDPIPTGSSINANRDGVIIPTASSLAEHLAVLFVQIPGAPGAVNGPQAGDPPLIDATYQGSIHQDLTLEFECEASGNPDGGIQ